MYGVLNAPAQPINYFEEPTFVGWRRAQWKIYERIAAERIDYFERKVGRVHGSKVLEIGCGTGEAVRELWSRGADACGSEHSILSVHTARENYPQIRFFSSDEVNFNDGAFDAVFLFHILEHIRSPTKIMSEVARLVAPGGYLYIRVPHMLSATGILFGRHWPGLSPEHVHFYSSRSLNLLARQYGFAPVVNETASDVRYLLGGMRRLLRGPITPTTRLRDAGYGMPSASWRTIVHMAQLFYAPFVVLERLVGCGDELCAIFRKPVAYASRNRQNSLS